MYILIGKIICTIVGVIMFIGPYIKSYRDLLGRLIEDTSYFEVINDLGRYFPNTNSENNLSDSLLKSFLFIVLNVVNLLIVFIISSICIVLYPIILLWVLLAYIYYRKNV